jgi:hypothetical protein
MITPCPVASAATIAGQPRSALEPCPPRPRLAEPKLISCAPPADDVRVRVFAVLGAATLLGAALFLAFLSSFYLTFPWENTEPPEVWWLDPLFVSACASVVCAAAVLYCAIRNRATQAWVWLSILIGVSITWGFILEGWAR